MVWKIFGGDNQGANEVGDEKIKVVSTLARDPISHLENYLAYYVGRLEPGYAILVTGGWGSGKTHQIKKVLPETHAYYVSLFGLNTPEDIEGQVFAAMYPGKAVFKKLAEKTDGVNLEIPLIGALGTGGLGSALTSIFIKDDVDKSKPLILDDLERSTVDIKVLLGLINRYVEHHRCRVIVIAHDDKIVKDFVEAKEKSVRHWSWSRILKGRSTPSSTSLPIKTRVMETAHVSVRFWLHLKNRSRPHYVSFAT